MSGAVLRGGRDLETGVAAAVDGCELVRVDIGAGVGADGFGHLLFGRHVDGGAIAQHGEVVQNQSVVKLDAGGFGCLVHDGLLRQMAAFLAVSG